MNIKGLIISGVLGLGLIGCAGMSQIDEMHFGLDAANAAYQAYCSGHADKAGCSAQNKAEAKKAYQLASQGIDDYANGSITQEQVDALIQKALKLFQDFQK